MKVVKWIPWDEAASYPDAPCGGMGGWFNFNDEGHRWNDYISIWTPESRPYIEAIRQSVLEKKLRHTGADHQRVADGVPLFEDNTVAIFSYRGWGDLMAAIWSEAENKDYCYMDFYM